MTDQDFAEMHTLRTHLMATCQWALKAGRYGLFEAINDAIAGINGTDGFLEYQRRTVKPQEAATLTIEPIDLSNTRAATDAMNRLADAAERAAKALDDVGQKQHGGVSVVTAGQVTQMEIKPQVHHMGKIGETEEYRPAIPYQEKVKPRTVRDEMGRSLDGGAL